jgi:hypothetical protein
MSVKNLGRKLSPNLIEKLKHGNLRKLFAYIKTDNDLELEVRKNLKAFVYYKKGKALEIGVNCFGVDKKYSDTVDLLQLANTQAAVDPHAYFTSVKKIMNDWLCKYKQRPEFEVQQNIASANRKPKSEYKIIDMEYNFERSGVDIADRRSIKKGNPNGEKKAGFDLLGIEAATGTVFLFEVKKGLRALEGTSGLTQHINDFEHIIHNSKYSPMYRANLERDIKNMVSDKNELSLLDFSLPDNYSIKQIEFALIFEPDNFTNAKEISDYKITFQKSKSASFGCRNQYKTFFVKPGSYALSKYEIL